MGTVVERRHAPCPWGRWPRPRGRPPRMPACAVSLGAVGRRPWRPVHAGRAPGDERALRTESCACRRAAGRGGAHRSWNLVTGPRSSTGVHRGILTESRSSSVSTWACGGARTAGAVASWSSVCRAYAGRRSGRSPRTPRGVVSAAGGERRESIRIRRLPVRPSQGRRAPNLAGAGKMDVLRRGMRRHGPLRYSGDYMMMERTMGSGTLPVVKWK